MHPLSRMIRIVSRSKRVYGNDRKCPFNLCALFRLRVRERAGFYNLAQSQGRVKIYPGLAGCAGQCPAAACPNLSMDMLVFPYLFDGIVVPCSRVPFIGHTLFRPRLSRTVSASADCARAFFSGLVETGEGCREILQFRGGGDRFPVADRKSSLRSRLCRGGR